jgi:hypothetical protein
MTARRWAGDVIAAIWEGPSHGHDRDDVVLICKDSTLVSRLPTSPISIPLGLDISARLNTEIFTRRPA